MHPHLRRYLRVSPPARMLKGPVAQEQQAQAILLDATTICNIRAQELKLDSHTPHLIHTFTFHMSFSVSHPNPNWIFASLATDNWFTALDSLIRRKLLTIQSLHYQAGSTLGPSIQIRNQNNSQEITK